VTNRGEGESIRKSQRWNVLDGDVFAKPYAENDATYCSIRVVARMCLSVSERLVNAKSVESVPINHFPWCRQDKPNSSTVQPYSSPL